MLSQLTEEGGRPSEAKGLGHVAGEEQSRDWQPWPPDSGSILRTTCHLPHCTQTLR